MSKVESWQVGIYCNGELMGELIIDLLQTPFSWKPFRDGELSMVPHARVYV
jgi:hypothetical protein